MGSFFEMGFNSYYYNLLSLNHRTSSYNLIVLLAVIASWDMLLQMD